MNVNIVLTAVFKREVKGLIKKYHSLKSELAEFEEELLENPKQRNDEDY